MEIFRKSMSAKAKVLFRVECKEIKKLYVSIYTYHQSFPSRNNFGQSVVTGHISNIPNTPKQIILEEGDLGGSVNISTGLHPNTPRK